VVVPFNTGVVNVDPVATCPVPLLLVYQTSEPFEDADKEAVCPQLTVAAVTVGVDAALTVTTTGTKDEEHPVPTQEIVT
jgi:hypothetical protein